MGLSPRAVGALAARADILPMAAEHGGFFFCRMDMLGMVAELHTIFTPEGWGREALLAGIEALNGLWLLGYQVLLTHELEANPRSQPPRSFGFRRVGDWRPSVVGPLRLWVLTKEAWCAAPASQRRAKCLS
jgi:hypothetical protein